MKKIIIVIIAPLVCSANLTQKIQFLKPSSPEKRLEYISKSEIWKPTEIEKMDILGGPDSELRRPLNSVVECTYDAPGATAYRGNSKKFRCAFGDKKLKVKYHLGADENKEVFAEAAATRLFWALGFFADRVYPVQVNCKNCPENLHEGTGARVTRLIPFALIEDKFSGIEIELKENQGWSFAELYFSSGKWETTLSERQVQIDALNLLAVLVQHSDRKNEQQRLSCPKDKLTYLEQNAIPVKKMPGEVYLQENVGEEICTNPQMLVHDIGFSFGGGGKFSKPGSGKFNLKQWRSKSVFSEKIYQKTFDASRGSGLCEGEITSSLRAKGGAMGDPLIREEGRVMLLGLLERFRDAGKIEELFTVANADATDESENKILVEGKVLKGVAAWSYVMREKIDQISKYRCCIPAADEKSCL